MKINASVNIIKVTPEQASEWLSNLWPGQRSKREAHIDKISSDMLAGKFKLGPDAILLVKGKLANGQHRLEAVVRTGKAQLFIVLQSSDDELYKIIDAGLKRTVADGLQEKGPYNQCLPSIARWVREYDVRTGMHEGGKVIGATQTVLIDYCNENRAVLAEAAMFVGTLYSRTRLLAQSVGGAIYAIGSRTEPEKIKDFLVAVYCEAGASAAGDLHNRLVQNRGGKSKLKESYLFALTIKAFKAYCAGKRIGTLKWTKDEVFPSL